MKLKTIDVIGDKIVTDKLWNGMPLKAWFPMYRLAVVHVLRQKREEKYKGLQHD